MNLRAHWKRHPRQLQLVGVVYLLLSPIIAPLLIIVAFREAIWDAICQFYSEVFQIIRGDGP